jgi:ABC-type thiamin/hydroxymethylpyrimidine transport system permease subunit
MLLCNVILGFADFLAGDPSGAATIYWGIAGGVVGELALWLLRYQPRHRVAMVVLAAAFYIPATNVVTYFIFGWQNNWQLYVGLGMGVIAIIVESAVPGILLGIWLKRTGLLRNVYVRDDIYERSTSGWGTPAPVNDG